MKDISIPAAYLIAIMLDMVLCGIHTCLFAYTAWLVHGEGKRFSPAILSIYILYLVNIARTVSLALDGYWTYISDPNGPMNRLVYHPSKAFNWWDNVGMIVVIAISDLTMFWRLWIIWSRNVYVMIVPAVLIITSAVFGIVDAFIAHEGWLFFIHESPVYVGCLAFGCSIASGCLVTALIVGKISYASRGFQRHPYFRVIVILVESQALTTIGMSICLILFIMKTNAAYTIFEILPKVIAIAPTLIILQLHLGFTQPMDAPTGGSKLNTFLRRRLNKDLEAAQVSRIQFATCPPLASGAVACHVEARPTTVYSEDEKNSDDILESDIGSESIITPARPMHSSH